MLVLDARQLSCSGFHELYTRWSLTTLAYGKTYWSVKVCDREGWVKFEMFFGLSEYYCNSSLCEMVLVRASLACSAPLFQLSSA